MAVLDPERASLPKSVLRYRPLTADDQARPGRSVTRPRRHVPDVLETEQGSLPRRRSVAPVQLASSRWRVHPLVFLGLTLLLAVCLWVGISQAVSWGTNALNCCEDQLSIALIAAVRCTGTKEALVCGW